MNGLKYILLMGVIISGFSFPATAQDEADDYEFAPEDLFFFEDEIVYTASRQEQKIKDAPSTITVISGEELKAFGIFWLPDLFRQIPGLDVSGATLAETEVSTRGRGLVVLPSDSSAAPGFGNSVSVGSSRMLVMIDGRSVYEDFWGKTYWATLGVTIDEIERIEIIRGPGSALYGANAFDGVINIITKPVETLNGTLFSVTGGERGTLFASALSAHQFEKWGYKISLNHQQMDDWNVVYQDELSDPDSEPEIHHIKDRESFNIHQVNAQTMYRLTPDQQLKVYASYTGGLMNVDSGDPVNPFEMEINAGTAWLQYQTPVLSLNLSWDGRYHVATNADYAQFNPNFDGDFDIQTQTFHSDLQYTIQSQEHHNMIFGASYRFNRFKSDLLNSVDPRTIEQFGELDVNDTQQEHLASMYGQDRVQIHPKIAFTAGLRYDYHSLTGNNLSPRGSLILSPTDKDVLRVSVGYAFRNPTAYESYVLLDSFVESEIEVDGQTIPFIYIFRLRGNDQLNPEKVRSIELAYSHYRKGLMVRLEGFHNQIEDFIISNVDVRVQPFPPDDPREIHQRERERYVNYDGTATGIGGELTLEYRPYTWLYTFFNWSYQEWKDDETGQKISFVPQHRGNVGIRYMPQVGPAFSTVIHYVGDIHYPETTPSEKNDAVNAYAFVELSAGYSFLENVRASVSVFNLFDEDFRGTPTGEILLGRRIVGQMSISF